MSAWASSLLSAGAEEPKGGDTGSNEDGGLDENLLPTNTLFYGVSGQQVWVCPAVQAFCSIPLQVTSNHGCMAALE